MIYLVAVCYLWFGDCCLFASCCCLVACLCLGGVFVVPCCCGLRLVIWLSRVGLSLFVMAFIVLDLVLLGFLLLLIYCRVLFGDLVVA